MRISGWILAATVAAVPSLARADDVFDHAHKLLGEGVGDVVAGRFHEAIPKLQKAVRENPRLRNGYYNLGVAYRQLGDNDAAVAEYEMALRLTPPSDTPGMAQALYGQALARDARGDVDAWNQYLAWARPRASEQAAVRIAKERQEMLAGIRVPGTQKAVR
jgi:tetratricopeptide (TPR) repeat protein